MTSTAIKNTAFEATAETPLGTVAGFVCDIYPAFSLQFWPAGGPRAHIVYLPPFGEEMNRCRSMVAEQARWFAGEGMSCSILDFYGTGESRGDLTDATLPIWRHNIDDLIDQLLKRKQCPVYLWGCRLGSLLALDYLSLNPGLDRKLLLWQPVVSGSAFVTQMLRQRTASLIQKGENPESTADMKLRLAAGDTIEVAGYRLGGELLSAIDKIEIGSILQDGMVADSLDIFWLEHTGSDDALPGAKTNRAISQLQEAGARIVIDTFTGNPVWQLNKRSTCDDLLVKTRKFRL